MTATEAYRCDPDFRNLVDEWDRERHCSLPLVDRCLELEMLGAAECARWAATEPEREWVHEGVNKGFSYPYPAKFHGDHGYYWWAMESWPHQKCHWVPFGRMLNGGGTQRSHATPLLAILWILDNWLEPVVSLPPNEASR